MWRRHSDRSNYCYWAIYSGCYHGRIAALVWELLAVFECVAAVGDAGDKYGHSIINYQAIFVGV